MSTMITEVYDTLISASADEKKACDAIKAIVQYRSEREAITINQMMMKWMVGFNLAFTIAILWRVFV